MADKIAIEIFAGQIAVISHFSLNTAASENRVMDSLNKLQQYASQGKSLSQRSAGEFERILQAISETPAAVEVILGSNDSRMGQGWPEMLRTGGVKLQVIAGANHFFTDEREFDLLDSVLASLRSR